MDKYNKNLFENASKIIKEKNKDQLEKIQKQKKIIIGGLAMCVLGLTSWLLWKTKTKNNESVNSEDELIENKSDLSPNLKEGVVVHNKTSTNQGVFYVFISSLILSGGLAYYKIHQRSKQSKVFVQAKRVLGQSKILKSITQSKVVIGMKRVLGQNKILKPIRQSKVVIGMKRGLGQNKMFVQAKRVLGQSKILKSIRQSKVFVQAKRVLGQNKILKSIAQRKLFIKAKRVLGQNKMFSGTGLLAVILYCFKM